MKILKGLVIGLIVLAIIAVGVGLMLPDKAQLERSVVIDARPATVYTVLNGFHQFNQWSPWADLDPKTVYTFSGPPVGVGARNDWSSADPNVGGGSQLILESKPYAMVKVKLNFDGMDMDNLLTYTLAPEGAGTRLTWTYESDFDGDLLNRYFGLFLDRMIGPDFDKGLGKLKPFIESLPKDDFTTIDPVVEQVEAKPIAYLAAEAPMADAAKVIGPAYMRIGQFLKESGVAMAGAPMAVTREYNLETRYWKFDAAILLDKPCTQPSEDDDMKCGSSYAGWVIFAKHKGPYETMGETYAKITAFKTVAGLQDAGNSWESYVTDPTTVAPADIVTYVYWPIK